MNLRFNQLSFFISKVLKRIPLTDKVQVKFNSYRHYKINNYLELYFEDACKRTSNRNVNNKNEGPIWIFWWQGISKMPDLVKNCFLSVKRNAGNRRVILVDKNNYYRYSNLSPKIIKLFEDKRISIAHFSDILRFNLLKNNGGLWLDATIIVSDKIEDWCFRGLYTCSGLENPGNFFVTNGNWCIFILGGPKDFPLFNYMCNFYEIYFTKNDFVVDYFMTDYALNYAWKRNISNFKNYSMNKNNPDLYLLMPLLNKKFNKKEWIKISKETNMFKLTYKKKLKQGKGTFYDVVVKENNCE